MVRNDKVLEVRGNGAEHESFIDHGWPVDAFGSKPWIAADQFLTLQPIDIRHTYTVGQRQRIVQHSDLETGTPDELAIVMTTIGRVFPNVDQADRTAYAPSSITKTDCDDASKRNQSYARRKSDAISQDHLPSMCRDQVSPAVMDTPRRRGTMIRCHGKTSAQTGDPLQQADVRRYLHEARTIPVKALASADWPSAGFPQCRSGYEMPRGAGRHCLRFA